MHYTVRLTIRAANSRRTFKSFIRDEYAMNTSSHATRFDSIEAAENAADVAFENYEGKGCKVMHVDFFTIDW